MAADFQSVNACTERNGARAHWSLTLFDQGSFCEENL